MIEGHWVPDRDSDLIFPGQFQALLFEVTLKSTCSQKNQMGPWSLAEAFLRSPSQQDTAAPARWKTLVAMVAGSQGT